MGNNLPPGAENDPRAPYNREPPTVERKAMDVTLGVTIEVPEYAENDREVRAIKKAIDRGDYQLLDHETAEVLEVKKP